MRKPPVGCQSFRLTCHFVSRLERRRKKNVWCAGGGLTEKGLRGLLAPCQRSMMVTVDGDERVADRPHASVLKEIDRRC